MTLEELITALEAADPTLVLPHGFTNPHSYRGYYDELAFEPTTNVTVADMLADARSALGTTMTGWKGGDFTMRGYTDCWLAQEGSAGGETLGPLLLQFMLDAGIRDAARQTTGQDDTEPALCGSRSLPTYSGEVVFCVLETGHATQCRSAAEHPYVSWPNPSNGEGWRTVGQPAEAQPADEARPPREQWRIEVLDGGAEWAAMGSATDTREAAEAKRAAADKRYPQWANGDTVERRVVRETTTWTVEDAR